MSVEILKNPVIFGLLAGAIVYNYMAWNRKKQIEKRLKKGKTIKKSLQQNDIIIPAIIAVIVWFIAYAYFNYKEEKTLIQQKPVQGGINPTLPTLPSLPNQQLGGINSSASDVAKSFTLVNKTGITMPNVFV